jgi:hypothetical protein
MASEAIEAWLSESLDDNEGLKRALAIVDWAAYSGLVTSIQGGEVAVGFPWLAGSDGWLAVSALDSSANVRFDQLKTDPRFGRGGCDRLMRRIDHEGFVKKDTAARSPSCR